MSDVRGVSQEFAEAHRSFSGRVRGQQDEPLSRGGRDAMDSTTKGIVVGSVLMAMLAYSVVMWIFTKGAVKKINEQRFY